VPIGGFSMSAGFLTGVRAPNVDDYARLDAGRPGLLLPTRGTLAPEAAYSGEFGVRTGYHRLEATAYYAFTHVSSLVVLSPTTVAGANCTMSIEGQACERLLARQSSGPAQLHSVEAAMRLYLFWGLYLRGHVNYTHGTFVAGALPPATTGPTAGAPSEPSPVPRIPPVNGVAAIEMRRPRSIFSFAEVAVTWAGPQPRLAVQDAFDPTVCVPGALSCRGSLGFLVVALRGSLRLNDQLHVSGAIDNVVNDSYRYHGSGVDGAGVGANVALEGIY
jgi:hemoglobin/transferrin/lactoferrin receptor protein